MLLHVSWGQAPLRPQPAPTCRSLLSPQQCRVMAGGEGAAGSVLGASPGLRRAAGVLFASRVVSPVGNWLLWRVPALRGTELLLQGKDWQVAMDNGGSCPSTSHLGTGATVLTPVTGSVLPSNSCPVILLPGRQFGPAHTGPIPVQVLPARAAGRAPAAGLGKELLLGSGLAC